MDIVKFTLERNELILAFNEKLEINEATKIKIINAFDKICESLQEDEEFLSFINNK